MQDFRRICSVLAGAGELCSALTVSRSCFSSASSVSSVFNRFALFSASAHFYAMIFSFFRYTVEQNTWEMLPDASSRFT